MKQFKNIRWIFVAILAFMASPTLAVTDTIYVQKRITDTLYVASPPDTVYIQESASQQPQEQATLTQQKNEYLLDYNTDTIAPGRKFYINIISGFSLFSIWGGAPLFDLSWEIENKHRGSTIFNISTIMLFGDHSIKISSDDEKTWEGFRSIISPGIGYRQYLLTFSIDKTNPEKLEVIHRNTPLNSSSFYIQALGNPTFKIAYDKNLKRDKNMKGSFDAGFSTKATLGYIRNMGNMLWDFGITFGYQYWSDKARQYLNWCEYKNEGFSYHFLNGMTGKGLFFGTEFNIGF
ncbi:hypothetical protein [Fibrobacter sp. UWB11]|uniref:hypothetical protein n=1 Tax=Fibrobacter sp. UWB11 TaxID=1896202 RepID=UPI00092B8191|nr:hypothetical protein [Fibrobacter sp. UWB11]SIO08226.1 hypothetical protein SAMN05720758_1325 [Fibrobacter sp. UWB11]